MLSTDNRTRLVDEMGILESPVVLGPKSCIFSDVACGGIYSLSGSRIEVLVPHRKGIGGIASTSDGALVVTGRNISLKRPGIGTTEVIREPSPEEGISSFNDLVVDAKGRIYVGALNLQPPTPSGTACPTSILLIGNDGSSRVVASDLRFPNGMVLTDGGEHLLVADSELRCIYSFEVAPDGLLMNRRTFIEWADGKPDGMALAEDDSIWVAVTSSGGGFVDVLDSGGNSRRRLAFDEPLVTNVALGSASAPRLLVTTGSAPGRVGQGRLYEVGVGVPPGAPLHRAVVAVRRDEEP